MQYSFLAKSDSQSDELKPPSCRIFFARIYLSQFMQVFYTLIISLCLLNMLIKWLMRIYTSSDALSLSGLFQILEISICTAMACEVVLKIYSQEPYHFCRLNKILDIPISVFCISSIILSFDDSLRTLIGEGLYDILLIIRNLVFFGRILMVFTSRETVDMSLTIKLNGEPRPALGKKFIFERIRYRYRPTMETLFEQEEENDSESEKKSCKDNDLTYSNL